jgi:hypothetical protein
MTKLRYGWLILVLAPLGARADEAPKTVMHRIEAGLFDTGGWTRAESTNGNFAVLMPGPFNDFSVSGGTSQPADRMEGIGGRAPNGIVFTALKLLYNAKGTAAAEFAKYKTGEGLPPATIKSADLNGNPGLDLTYVDGALSVHERVLMSGENLYTLSVEWPEAKGPQADSMFDPFVNSFKILAAAPPRIENPTIWQHEQLTQQYMQTLNKDACMKKTIATLGRSGCATQQCLASVGGATGDCLTWSSGDKAQFCATYESRYIDKNCGPDGLDQGRCTLLHGVRSAICDKPQTK